MTSNLSNKTWVIRISSTRPNLTPPQLWTTPMTWRSSKLEMYSMVNMEVTVSRMKRISTNKVSIWWQMEVPTWWSKKQTAQPGLSGTRQMPSSYSRTLSIIPISRNIFWSMDLELDSKAGPDTFWTAHGIKKKNNKKLIYLKIN